MKFDIFLSPFSLLLVSQRLDRRAINIFNTHRENMKKHKNKRNIRIVRVRSCQVLTPHWKTFFSSSRQHSSLFILKTWRKSFSNNKNSLCSWILTEQNSILSTAELSSSQLEEEFPSFFPRKIHHRYGSTLEACLI